MVLSDKSQSLRSCAHEPRSHSHSLLLMDVEMPLRSRLHTDPFCPPLHSLNLSVQGVTLRDKCMGETVQQHQSSRLSAQPLSESVDIYSPHTTNSSHVPVKHHHRGISDIIIKRQRGGQWLIDGALIETDFTKSQLKVKWKYQHGLRFRWTERYQFMSL